MVMDRLKASAGIMVRQVMKKWIESNKDEIELLAQIKLTHVVLKKRGSISNFFYRYIKEFITGVDAGIIESKIYYEFCQSSCTCSQF